MRGYAITHAAASRIGYRGSGGQFEIAAALAALPEDLPTGESK